VFRVGFVDERLPYRGLTHLVEHLTLYRVPANAGFAFNGETGLVHTSFYIRGTPGEVVEFLKFVSFSLRALPKERVEAEARVLQTEALKRGPTVMGRASAVRFGARHAGTLDSEELALIDPTPHVSEWARYWFNASNAALWIKGDVPAGIDIRLPAGEWRPPPAPPPPAVELPAVVREGTQTVAVTFPTDRSAAAYLLPLVLRDRLHERLRGQEGRVYGVQVNRELLTADHALLALQTDCLAEQAQVVTDLAQGVVGEMAMEGPTAEELRAQAAAVERSMREAGSAGGRVVGAATDYLQGRPALDSSKFLDDLATVTPIDVAKVLRQARTEAVWVVPKQVGVSDRRLATVDQREFPELHGRVFTRSQTLDDASATDALVLAPDGLCLVSGFGFRRTVLFGHCEAALVWTNAVTVIGADGFRVSVHCDEWTDGGEVLRLILSVTPPSILLRLSQPLASSYLKAVAAQKEQAQPGESRRARRWSVSKT
jgi:predicted Zn-dependent peptidase